MKQLFKNLLLPLAFIPFVFLFSCGGGSSDSSADNIDTAPATLDALSLDVFGDGVIVFNFTSLDDLLDNGIESGTVASFSPPTTTYDIYYSDNGTNFTTYDTAVNLSNMSYTYEKQGQNAGKLVVIGQGLGDVSGNIDIFVNLTADTFWTFTLDLAFGENGGVIAEVGANILLENGTDDGVDYSDFLNTPVDGITLSLQSGGNVPVGYDLLEAANVARTTSKSLYPTDLSDAGELQFTFDSSSISGYQTMTFYGVTSNDQGFDTASDQGVFNIDIVNSNGLELNYRSVPYAWVVDENFPSRAVLGFTLPDGVDSLGNTVTGGTQAYEFDFRTTETGRFVQTQPNTTNSIAGSFSLPNLDLQ